MEPDHVKVQAFGVHRVAAELARHSASRVGNRLFQQGLISLLFSTPHVMPGLLAFRPFAARRRRPKTARIRIIKSVRCANLPLI
jgi:hypothetical protein